MKSKAPVSDRRSFLKTGALAAAPFAAAAPVVAMADDGSRARLARLEDEREIEWLQRTFLRHVNGAGDCSGFVASSDAVQLDAHLRTIADDPANDGTLELAPDGTRASALRPVKVELETDFEGDSTLEQMARFQGQGSHRSEERRVLATDFVKSQDGWRIAKARFV